VAFEALSALPHILESNLTSRLVRADQSQLETTFRVSPSLERPTTAAGVLAGRMWLEQCNKGHSCMASASASRDCHFVPKRLIYVDEDDSGIRLATSDVPTGAAYMSLSHCWGDAAAHGAYSLTSTRLDGYRRSIPVEKLPRTFVEAIQITRALGQKYLWIDSLCIIQDSKDDWAEQAADMWQIYTNSYLNISATASKNPDEGLFYRRPEKSQLPGFLHVGKDHPEYPRGDYRLYSESRWRRQVTNALVNSRAWVLQERVLAPRILHFASREVFWECNCLRASESYPEGIPPLMDCQDTITIKSEKTDNEDSSIPHYSLLRTWSSVVERYSELHLTFSSDKLVALSALPHQVSVTFPDAGTYLAGLWKGPLAAQLLWKSRTPRSARRSETYLAPSWSWACINGAIDPNFDYSGYEPYGNKSVSRPMLRILDAQTVTSASSRQFGAIKSAELKVAGCLLKVRLRERQKRPETERVTPLEQREQWTKLMATVIPGYTGDDMKLISNSIPESFSGTNLGIDAVNGILCTDESSGWFDGDSFGPRVTVGENLTVAVTLDAESETAALVGVDLFLLPVSCISANNRPYNRESYNIHSLGCLVLAREEIGGGDHLGRYRRVGMCELEDGAALCALLCGLGNQEDGEVTSEGLHPGSLALEDFVPETWPCKELEFIPRSYKLFQITIV